MPSVSSQKFGLSFSPSRRGVGTLVTASSAKRKQARGGQKRPRDREENHHKHAGMKVKK